MKLIRFETDKNIEVDFVFIKVENIPHGEYNLKNAPPK